MNQDIFVVVEHLQGKVADISYVMLAAARILARETGGQVIALLLGYNAQELTLELAADQVLYLNHPLFAQFTSDAYQKALSNLIQDKSPRAVLIGHTSIGMDFAGLISARLGLPLVSQCYNFQAENGSLKFVSQICGGKLMAEGDLPGPTVLVTVVPGGYKPEVGKSTQPSKVTEIPVDNLEGLRVALERYIEPDTSDVDISKEAVLISVGRGIQTKDNIELAEELSRELGGVVSASRPVVDQGWLPTTRLVGKSGMRVKPKIYLALGISGAPEHAEAITGCEMIIAVNIDPAAPIFNIAKFGTTADLLDLVPVLTEKVRQAKGN
jgi:electron transfer flavoprotein alpha subunit